MTLRAHHVVVVAHEGVYRVLTGVESVPPATPFQVVVGPSTGSCLPSCGACDVPAVLPVTFAGVRDVIVALGCGLRGAHDVRFGEAVRLLRENPEVSVSCQYCLVCGVNLRLHQEGVGA